MTILMRSGYAIVGGRNATREEIGCIFWLFGNAGCGATLISKTHLLTAAHCVKDSPLPIRVDGGSINKTTPTITRFAVEIFTPLLYNREAIQL